MLLSILENDVNQHRLQLTTSILQSVAQNYYFQKKCLNALCLQTCHVYKSEYKQNVIIYIKLKLNEQNDKLYRN